MEVVALNERLREEFAGVVKHFLTIRRDEIARVVAATASGGALVFAAAAVVPVPSTKDGEASPPVQAAAAASSLSTDQPQPDNENDPAPADVSATVKLSPGAVLPEWTQQYATLAKTILRRVNAYQYKSRDAFGRDIAELLQLADSNDQRMLLQQLVDQQHALMATAKPPGRAKRRKVNGIRIDSATIPGIQSRTEQLWACNVDMRGNVSTIGGTGSRERAVELYQTEVRDMLLGKPQSMAVLNEMASELTAACMKFDSEILQDAMKQVKQRLPISKHHDVASLTAVPTPQAASQPAAIASNPPTTPAAVKEKDTKVSRKRELVVDTAAPPTVTATTLGKPITPAAATPELVAKRTPTDNHSRVQFLRLRRLIQMRLCRHLEGREICTRMNEPGLDESWEPMGRLERGKVYAYSSKKYVNFSDFVLATLKRSVAACAHIFLLDTRENIDDHLLVCDQFSDEFRQRLHQNFQEASEQYRQNKMN